MKDSKVWCIIFTNSGGLDSSLIAALVVQLAKEEGMDYPVQTFSIGMDGSPDLIAARKVSCLDAQIFGCRKFLQFNMKSNNGN